MLLGVHYSSLDFVSVFSQSRHHHLGTVNRSLFTLFLFLLYLLKYSETRVRVFVINLPQQSLLSNEPCLLFHWIFFRHVFFWLLLVLLYYFANGAFVLFLFFLFGFFGRKLRLAMSATHAPAFRCNILTRCTVRCLVVAYML